MDNVNKASVLKELEIYTRLLRKHEALKKEKELKALIIPQARISQHFNKPDSFHSFKIVKNQCNPVMCSNQKYSLKKPSNLSGINQKIESELHNQRQNFKYSLSKSKVFNKVSPVNSKNLNFNVPVVNTKSISNSKSVSKVPSMTCNGSKKLTCNTKDFIKEIESLTKLLKKKASSNPCRILNSELKHKNMSQEISHKKHQNSVFDRTNMIKKETVFSKARDSVKMPSKIPANPNYVNKVNCFMNYYNKNNPSGQKTFNLNKSVYKKDNLKLSLNTNIAATLKYTKSINELKDGVKKNISRPSLRKVIFSDSKNVSPNVYTSGRASVFQNQHLSSQELVSKLRAHKVVSSNRTILKKSPHISKRKSPVLLKIKSSTVKAPKLVKSKQTNTRYTKINKHLTITDKRVQPEHSNQHKSLKKVKRKVNSKYKVINKTPKLNLNKKKTTDTLFTSVDKKASLTMDCDTFLETLNNSAVEKLEQNLLAISSELTAPLSVKKNENCNSKVMPSLTKVGSKVDSKRTPFKKSKSRISKYKIINSSVPRNFSMKNVQSECVGTPIKRERAVLVRRLFKSKNVIINKNATPTSYRAKMIKSKYLSLNKRKSSNFQKYRYPTSQNPKFKGFHLPARVHLRQKRFKTYAESMYHSKLIRKANFGHQTYKLIYKNSGRQLKNKVNTCFTRSPVVFIRGSQYAININGRTLKKLPIRGHTIKKFQRANFQLFKRAPENLIKAFPTSANMASRVLHRSINRILTASSKKKLSKVNTYCMFYNRFGRCNRGVKCTYIHDPSKIAVCTRFLRGTCKIDGCPFSHEVDPGKMAICSFFLVGQCDKQNCPYRHEKLSPNATLCKDFVQGYCHYGKECKRAHILICPKYMQGECDKGSLCAFPHPPQKIKKNVQEEEKEEERKPTEVLLEKVLRYFQQGGDSRSELNKNSTTNLFVPPKRRKLEEQPSFIPLCDSPAVMNITK